MLPGKLFQRVAIAFVNVRSPCVAVLLLGTVDEMVDSDRCHGFRCMSAQSVQVRASRT